MPRVTRSGVSRRRAAAYAARRSGRRLRRMFRNRVRRFTRSTRGYLKIVRKLPEMEIYASPTTVGAMTVNDVTGTCITLGTPVAQPGVNLTYDVPFSLKFSLNQLQNYTDITQLCDQYKIIGAYVRLNNNFVPNAQNLLATPWIEYYTDHDDANVPALNDVRQIMGVKTKYFSNSRPAVSMSVVPRFRVEIRDAAGATGFSISNKQWINSTYANIDHYSLKGVIHNVFLPAAGTPGGSMFNVDVSLKVIAKDFQ